MAKGSGRSGTSKMVSTTGFNARGGAKGPAGRAGALQIQGAYPTKTGPANASAGQKRSSTLPAKLRNAGNAQSGATPAGTTSKPGSNSSRGAAKAIKRGLNG